VNHTGIIRGSYSLIDVSPSLIVLESYRAVSAMGCFSTLRTIIKVRGTVRSASTVDIFLFVYGPIANIKAAFQSKSGRTSPRHRVAPSQGEEKQEKEPCTKAAQDEPLPHQFLTKRTGRTVSFGSDRGRASRRVSRDSDKSLSTLANSKSRKPIYNHLSSSVSTLRSICRESDRGKAKMTPRKKGKKEDKEPLREDIKNKMLLHNTKEKRFVPETALKEIFSKENIAQTLRRHKSSLETDIPNLVSFVYDKAIIIFAILVWSEAVKLIDQFYQHQFKDESLPVHFETDDDDNVKAFSCRPDGEVLIENHPFDDDEWTDRTLEHFCKDDQWYFLSPVFEENKFRYDFHESTHLPFVDKNHASQKESFFSVVREWRIHRDHLKSPRYVVRHPFPAITLRTYNQMLRDDLD
jgi:hypothetical protein